MPIYFNTMLMMEQLSAAEADRLYVYDDATGHPIGPGSVVHGHPTIGRGRALDIDGLTETESRLLCANDITKYVGELSKFSWWTELDPPRQRAIVQMRHQMGLEGLLGFHEMIAAMEAKDWAKAQQQGLNSLWARQTPDRAMTVMHAILTGVDPTYGATDGATQNV